jgi:hypothetical protein
MTLFRRQDSTINAHFHGHFRERPVRPRRDAISDINPLDKNFTALNPVNSDWCPRKMTASNNQMGSQHYEFQSQHSEHHRRRVTEIEKEEGPIDIDMQVWVLR